LADLFHRNGQSEEGLQALKEALALVQRSRGFLYEAELHRLRGELLLQADAEGNSAEAEACFQRALNLARGQKAKSLELRAAMSLGRLWEGRGKGTEAGKLLAEVFGWFTEGFDTPDLQEAKALLEEWKAGGGKKPKGTKKAGKPARD